MTVALSYFKNPWQDMMFDITSGMIPPEISLNMVFPNAYVPMKVNPVVNTYNQYNHSCTLFNK